MKVDVSIIIVTYNTCKMTSECIDSIIEKTSGISYEIILVDNASKDGSPEFFSNDSRVKYIFNEENIGFGKANNKGLEIAEGRNVLFLNSDTLLRNNAIKILSDYLDAHEDTGACGGNLYDLEGKPAQSFRMYFPSIYDDFNVLLGNIPDKIFSKRKMFFNFSEKNIEVKHIIGADLMVKYSVLKELGAFDPAFFMYREETELCHRIYKAGYKLISVPEAEITHFVTKTVNNFFVKKERLYMFEKSDLLYNELTHTKFHNKCSIILRYMTYTVKQLSPKKAVRESNKVRLEVLKELLGER